MRGNALLETEIYRPGVRVHGWIALVDQIGGLTRVAACGEEHVALLLDVVEIGHQAPRRDGLCRRATTGKGDDLRLAERRIIRAGDVERHLEFFARIQEARDALLDSELGLHRRGDGYLQLIGLGNEPVRGGQIGDIAQHARRDALRIVEVNLLVEGDGATVCQAGRLPGDHAVSLRIREVAIQEAAKRRSPDCIHQAHAVDVLHVLDGRRGISDCTLLDLRVRNRRRRARDRDASCLIRIGP
ncbi:hypothetical protein D3C75_776230 [compost metagenome]